MGIVIDTSVLISVERQNNGKIMVLRISAVLQ